MDFSSDHFSLFNLPPSFRVDTSVLDQRYREAQARVHPDKYVQSGDTERRLSLQWATRVNEAYQMLKKPLSRAQYLLKIRNHPIDAENNLAMPSDFLMDHMEWREAVFEPRTAREQDELERLHSRVKQGMTARYEELGTLLDDQQDYEKAVDRVRRLMFLEKLLFDIDDAIAVLEH